MQCTDAGAEMRGVQTTKEYRKIHECPQRCMKTCSGLQENLWEVNKQGITQSCGYVQCYDTASSIELVVTHD